MVLLLLALMLQEFLLLFNFFLLLPLCLIMIQLALRHLLDWLWVVILMVLPT